MPVILTFFALAVILFMLVGFVTYEYCIRDTWTRDNYSMLVARLDEARALVNSRNDDKALEKYREITAIIGNHAIENWQTELKDGLAYSPNSKKGLLPNRRQRN